MTIICEGRFVKGPPKINCILKAYTTNLTSDRPGKHRHDPPSASGERAKEKTRNEL